MECWNKYAYIWRKTIHEFTFYEDLQNRFGALTSYTFLENEKKDVRFDDFPLDIQLYRELDAISAREYLNDLPFVELVKLKSRIDLRWRSKIFISMAGWLADVRYSMFLRGVEDGVDLVELGFLPKKKTSFYGRSTSGSKLPRWGDFNPKSINYAHY